MWSASYSVRAVERSITGDSAAARAHRRPGLDNLSWNIGSSVGISVVNALLTTNTYITSRYRNLTYVDPMNQLCDAPNIAQFWNSQTATRRAAHQAQIIAYIDEYKLLMIATLAVVPLIVIFKNSAGRGGTT